MTMVMLWLHWSHTMRSSRYHHYCVWMIVMMARVATDRVSTAAMWYRGVTEVA